MMPEGPELKISSDLINPLIQNHIVIDAYPTDIGRYGKGNFPVGYESFIKSIKLGSCYIKQVQVKGKFMYWSFSNDWYMFCTFGMTGQMSPARGKHPCFVFQHVVSLNEMQKYQEMYFNDPRHFGTIKFVQGKPALEEKLSELGWDPLARSIQEWGAFIHTRVRVSKKTIAELLMNQSLFAGVGNYIRAEALYLSKLSPWRTGNSLNSDEIDRLQQAIVDVMKDSYDHQGATILTYKDAYGAEGKYSSCFKVYGQKTDPLGNKITKETAADGRTIHWSPAVQI